MDGSIIIPPVLTLRVQVGYIYLDDNSDLHKRNMNQLFIEPASSEYGTQNPPNRVNAKKVSLAYIHESNQFEKQFQLGSFLKASSN